MGKENLKFEFFIEKVLAYPDAFDFCFVLLCFIFLFLQVKTCARFLLSLVFDCLFWDIILNFFETTVQTSSLN